MISPLLTVRPRFSAVAPFLVLAVVAAIAVAACSSGVAATFGPAPASAPVAGETALTAPSAAASAPAPTAPAGAIVVHVRDFSLDPAEIDATSRTIALFVINDGPTIHNVSVRNASGQLLFATRDLKPGESQVVSATLPPGGPFITFCSLPGHESLGIRGSLVVKAP